VVFLADGNRKYLWNSELKQFGVDGFRIGRSIRGDEWYQDVPAELAQQAAKVHIHHTHAPRNDFYKKLGEVLKEVADIIEILSQLGAMV